MVSRESYPKETSEDNLVSDGVPAYRGEPMAQTTTHEEQDPRLSRSLLIVQRVHTQLSFFHERLKSHRKHMLVQTVMIYLMIGTLVLGIFSIYWGAAYQRDSRIKNLRMLVVIEDVETVDGVSPVMGDTMASLLATPEAQYYGDWQVQNLTEFRAQAASHGHSVSAEIEREVHRQNYWASLHVQANASVNWVNAVMDGDVLYNVSANTVVAYYETGRDQAGMLGYVEPSLKTIEEYFLDAQSNITALLLAAYNTLEIFQSMDSVRVVLAPLAFVMDDARPFTDPVLTAPSQVGLIYIVIITLFTFNFFTMLYQELGRSGMKHTHFVVYRILLSVVSYFVISFFFSLVTLAFQVDFGKAFGRGGWPVYWMTNFLTMWAVGAMNETMAMLFIAVFPPLVGFWMLFWVIINISATFAPIALCARFYRFTYAMPVHASYEITKVIFYDTYRGAMGRNYGILIAWSVLATVGMVFSFMNFTRVMRKRAMAERQKVESEIMEKQHIKFAGREA